ncbi:cell surface A33 antigen-like isoform X2 [Nelusetta ayraudi]|uniref:cell surface A33 antigen-like isoform X2 n=1 Tax=Nelusetta ayraudi TaxID=303726 RepID=UPI003F6FCF58
MLPYSRSMHVTIGKEEYEAAKGGEVTLPCSFSPANPEYTNLVLSWKAFPDKEGDPMIPVATYFLGSPSDISPGFEGRTFLDVDTAQKTSTLRITKVTMQDSRYFQCNVQVPNDDEGQTLAITSVLVLVPPSPPICKIEGRPEYGQNISLTCKSEEGSPEPTTKWKTFTVENVPRRYPPKAFQSPDGVLHLFNVSKETSGFFICDSTNRLGSQSCNLTLSVMPGSMNFGSTALIVVGVLAGVLLVGIVIFCCCRRRRREKQKNVEGAPEDAYFDKNAPETGEEYEDSEPSKETKRPIELKTVPQNYRNDRKVGAKYEDDQHSNNSDKDSENASRRYQNEQHEGYRGSRDRLDDRNDHYRGSRDRLDDQRNRYGGSRDRLDDNRDQYKGSRDRLDDNRDQYKGSREPNYDNRDQYRSSRDRLDDRSDHYGGGSHSDHYGGSSGHHGGGHSSGGYSYGDD